MKISVGVLFGGRSVENEISVVTALQTIEAMDREKYEVVPIYIAKTGRWYSSPELLELSNYKDMDRLLQSSREVYMKPLYGDRNLYDNSNGLFRQKPVAQCGMTGAWPVRSASAELTSFGLPAITT